MAKRIYKDKNVYDAAIERLDFIFANFERVYLSFSGGKDSGVMLNLVIDYMRKNKIDKKLGIQILDNEANYELSEQFMHRMIQNNLDILDEGSCSTCLSVNCEVCTNGYPDICK